MLSACRRPFVSATRYCCKGATPNVKSTSYSASVPVGPSVQTKNLSPRRENEEVSTLYSKRASRKSPRTVDGVARCIARSWCEPLHRSASSRWHDAQTETPTKAGASDGGGCSDPEPASPESGTRT